MGFLFTMFSVYLTVTRYLAIRSSLASMAPYTARYNSPTSDTIFPEQLKFLEIFGNFWKFPDLGILAETSAGNTIFPEVSEVLSVRSSDPNKKKIQNLKGIVKNN